MATLRRLERVTRLRNEELAAAMRRRWDGLSEHVKTPGQVLGRRGVGCEGTHGVFPKCNLACTPCYHSRDANQVRPGLGARKAEEAIKHRNVYILRDRLLRAAA